MKYLIINGDDFGVSRGVNHGIIEAHQHGILTSTSLIVSAPWSEEAAVLSRLVPSLSIGLHVYIIDQVWEPASSLTKGENYRTVLYDQLSRFEELMGCLPTHLDSHHNLHSHPRLLPLFLELARQYDLPLRAYSPIRYFSKFYGQWDGETHLEQISVANLTRMLETEVQEGITELSCHPGYIDLDFRSSYSVEREVELQTLCNPRLRQILTEQSIQLVSFRDLTHILTSLPT